MCVIPAMDYHPQPEEAAPNAKPLNPHAQPFQPPTTFQQLNTLVVPVTSRRFFFQQVFTYHPKPFWTIYPAKVECYNAFAQPPQENFKPCFFNSVDEDCSDGKVVTKEEMVLSAEESGFGDVGKKKMGKGGKRVLSPRLRRLRKEWASMNAAVKKGEGSQVLSSSTDFEAMLGGKTSLMIKNIPNQFE